MDAMDFYIVLSPQDKFNFTVSKAAGQRPVMGWDGDKSCVIGPPAGSTSYQFPVTNAAGANNNSYVYDESALNAGHIEVLAAAALTKDDDICYDSSNDPEIYTNSSCVADGGVKLFSAATHVNGLPPNCAALSAVLISPDLVSQLKALVTNAPNSLLGRYVVTVPGGGIEGGGDAIAIQNSDLTLSAQSQDKCVDASGNCVSSYSWDTREYDHPHLGDMPPNQLAYFNAGMAALNVAGDWSNNPTNQVGVDWVLSFPTKYLYEDVNLPPDLSGTTPPEGWPNFTMLPATPTNLPAGGDVVDPWPYEDPDADIQTQNQFCLGTEVTAYGVDEESGTMQEVVSPSPSATLDFCNETNVLTYQINGQAVEPSYLATNDSGGTTRRTTVSFTVSSAKSVTNGWGVLGLMWGENYEDEVANPAAAEGIVYTVRDTDQANINNGSLTELQKNVQGQIGDED
jgi:hypothetical protein